MGLTGRLHTGTCTLASIRHFTPLVVIADVEPAASITAVKRVLLRTRSAAFQSPIDLRLRFAVRHLRGSRGNRALLWFHQGH